MITGKKTGKGFKYEMVPSENTKAMVFSADIKENRGVWFRRYSNQSCISASESKYGGRASFGGADTPTTSPGSGAFDVQEGEMFSASMVPNGTQIQSWLPGLSNVQGMTWDGSYLWMVSQPSGHMYKFKTDGTQLDAIPVSTNVLTGMTWDGTYFWVADGNSNYVYQFKPNGTQTGNGWTVPGSIVGIAWDGSYFWTNYFNVNYVYQFTTDGVEINNWVPGAGGDPKIGCFDGSYLCIPDGDSNYMYRFRRDGTEVGKFP